MLSCRGSKGNMTAVQAGFGSLVPFLLTESPSSQLGEKGDVRGAAGGKPAWLRACKPLAMYALP